MVVGFDGCTGGTFFPHGHMLAGLQAPPDGVSEVAQEGILVQSRRGRALLWSNHRSSVDSSGKVMPLHSSLHQSVLLAAPQSAEVPRRVCIFGWAQEGRKWERCGFHECLDYETPEVRAKFFNRTVREEQSGWEGGPRGHEVSHQSKTHAAQKEIQEGYKLLTFDVATKDRLANYGRQDNSQIFELMINTRANGFYEWQFLTIGGTCKWFFKCESRAMTVEEMIRRARQSYEDQVGVMVSNIDVLDHHTCAKVKETKKQVQHGQRHIIALKVSGEASAPTPLVAREPEQETTDSGLTSGAGVANGQKPQLVDVLDEWGDNR